MMASLDRGAGSPVSRGTLARRGSAESNQGSESSDGGCEHSAVSAKARLSERIGGPTIPRASQPVVSVCIPTFNRRGYLTEAMESVLAQSFGDFELVISDNASTDDTAEAVLSFGDPRIRYFRNDRNIGAPANWLNAVANALGRYCAIIGDDDRWAPTLLEQLVPPLDDNPDVDVAFSDHWLIDADGCVLAARSNQCSQDYGRVSLQPGRHKPFLDLALHAQALLTTCALIRRESMLSLGALDPQAGGMALDYYLFARIALAGRGAFYVPGRLAYYRVHPRSGSARHQVQVWQDMQRICAYLVHHVPAGRHETKIRRRWARALANEGVALLHESDRSGAIRALGRSLRMAPFTIRPWLALGAAAVFGSWPPFRGLTTPEEV